MLLSWGGEREPTACFRVVSTLAAGFLSYYPSIHHSLSFCCFKLLQQSVNCCHFEFYHPSFDCFGFIVGCFFFFFNSGCSLFYLFLQLLWLPGKVGSKDYSDGVEKNSSCCKIKKTLKNSAIGVLCMKFEANQHGLQRSVKASLTGGNVF